MLTEFWHALQAVGMQTWSTIIALFATLGTWYAASQARKAAEAAKASAVAGQTSADAGQTSAAAAQKSADAAAQAAQAASRQAAASEASLAASKMPVLREFREILARIHKQAKLFDAGEPLGVSIGQWQVWLSEIKLRLSGPTQIKALKAAESLVRNYNQRQSRQAPSERPDIANERFEECRRELKKEEQRLHKLIGEATGEPLQPIELDE